MSSDTKLNCLRSHPGVPLLQHLQGVSERASAFAEVMPLSLPFDSSLLVELAGLCGYYHDVAKSTPYFQDYLCKKRPKSDLTSHALPSAVVAFTAARKVCSAAAEPWRTLLPTFVFMAVRAHHGDLRSLYDGATLLETAEIADTLVVLNTIGDARETYESLATAAQSAGYRSFYLTAQVTPKERLERIKAIREAVKFRKEAQSDARQGTSRTEEAFRPILVISTQLIEAGVDIDVVGVTRDAAPFDSLLQVAGRANRHAERDRIAEIRTVEAVGERFRGAKIYDSTLLDVTRQILQRLCPLNESDYLEAGQTYVEELLPRIDQSESEQHIAAIRTLDYSALDGFNLIEDEAESESVYIELDETAQALWRRYEALGEIGDRWKRHRWFNEFRGAFFQYVIQVRVRQLQENLPPRVNGLLYVSQDDLETHYDQQTGFRMESKSPVL